MAWRFKASKYKNAAPKVSKSEDWIRDLSVDTYQVNGSPIDASASFMAFNVDAGGTICVLPLTQKGRIPKDRPHIYAHSDVVSALTFSPFDDGLLATGAQDSLVKLWSIPKDGLSQHVSSPEATLTLGGVSKRVESLSFHPTADFLLSVVLGSSVQLWDVRHQKNLATLSDQPDIVYTTAWSLDGAKLATTAKDRRVRVVDPRANKVTHEAESHEGQRESLVTWLSDPNLVLTSGFDSSRQRQIFVRDLRKFSEVQGNLVFDSSTGILLPLFDFDTNMMFFCGKTDTTIFYYELTDREPMFIEGLRHSGQQMKGACLVPKRGLNVMEGEVNRVLQLVSGGVVPVSYIVPRKTYREFHTDLYPETSGCDPSLLAEQWIAGTNRPAKKISLDPAKWKELSMQTIRGPLTERDATPVEVPKTKNVGIVPPVVRQTSVSPKPAPKLQAIEENVPVAKPRLVSSPRTSIDESKDAPVPQPRVPSVKRSVSLRISAIEERNIENEKDAPILRRSDSLRKKPSEDKPDGLAISKQNDRISKILGHVSKFRHLKGTVLHKSLHIENVKGFDQSLPAECDGIQVNGQRIAVPLAGPGGRVAVFEVDKPGRIPDGTIPALFSGCKVMDLTWDPFNDRRLAVACEDGRVRFWTIPEGGLLVSSNEPDPVLENEGNSDRVSLVKFHPLANNVLLIVTSDYSIRIWDLSSPVEAKMVIKEHNDQVFSVSWSPCGKFIATVCKDGLIRIFEPRKTTEPLRTGTGPSGVKGARILWAVDGKVLIVCGFDRQSERHVSLYKTGDLELLHKLVLDVSPILLIPFYDEDSSTVFLTGKGDSTVHCYEVSLQSPYLHLLSPHRCSQIHRSIGFMPKSICNVKLVEFAKAYCLTSTTLEPVSFTVPRLKVEYFQDDLFPPTRQLWIPALTSEEWFNGKDKVLGKISLQPEGMPALHESKPTPQPAPRQAANPLIMPRPSYKKPSREKEEQIENSLSNQISVDLKLEQDEMEGVDESEWE